uniref:E3 ubiquitin-protein ligase TRIM21-like n=1 Tax=Fundulus heteroclitus TaxID=8078 RepID=A0A3Q2QU31_FUNHE
MSTASCLLSEDHFRCFICQNVFTDPVSTPCGHNFCKSCMTEDVCPECQRMVYPKPELHVNTVIAELLDVFRRSAQRQNPEAQAAEPRRGYFFTNRGIVIIAMALLFVLSAQIKENPHLAEETKGEKPEKPEVNIRDMIEEIKHCSQLGTEDVWTFSSAKRCLNLTWDQMKLLSAAHLEQIFTQVMRKETPRLLMRAELLRAQRYAADVTLDPDTVHAKLFLSDDRKQVRCCVPKRSLPHNPKRFIHFKYVLGEQSFSSGRFYFEVQVKGKTNWTLGVAEESIRRFGLMRLRPQSGSWTLTVRNGNEFCGQSEPPVCFSPQPVPEKVGVFVDYEEGLVLFYDVDAAALIYSFTGCFFTERLHPFFGPGHNYDGTNDAPLIITPVRLQN